MSKKHLKIGFVFDDSLDRTDGVQQYILTLGAWLHAQGHEVRYLVGETDPAHNLNQVIYSLSRNISVRGNQNTLSLPLPASGKKIKQILDAEQFDVLHVQMPYNPLLAGRVIAAASKRTAIVGTFHIVGAGWIERWGSLVLGRVQSRTLARFDTFLAVSSAAQTFAKNTFRINSEISPNVVDVSQFGAGKKQAFMRGKNTTITFLGRLVERKGCEYLLKALIILREKHQLDGIRVNICGDGPLRSELEQFVSDNSLHDTVVFHGYISEEDKPDFLASSDIAVFPATGGESFGIVLIEAMAAKNTVVLGGANEGYKTVLEGSTDQLFNPADTDMLAQLLHEYIASNTKRKTALAWQQDRIKQFDVSTVGFSVVEIYRSAMLAAQKESDYTR